MISQKQAEENAALLAQATANPRKIKVTGNILSVSDGRVMVDDKGNTAVDGTANPKIPVKLGWQGKEYSALPGGILTAPDGSLLPLEGFKFHQREIAMNPARTTKFELVDVTDAEAEAPKAKKGKD